MTLKIVKSPAEMDKKDPKMGYLIQLTGKNHYIIGNETYIHLTDDDVRTLKLWAMDLVMEDVRKPK